MRLSHPLRAVIPSLDGVVLEVLAGTTAPLNAGLIARIAGTGSVSGVRIVLARLESEGLVVRERLGEQTYVRANRAHLAWPAIESILALPQTLWKRIGTSVASWATAPFALGVFGSAARGEADNESDIDLLVIWDDDVDPDYIGSQQHLLATEIEQWVGNRVQFYSISRADLERHARHEEPILESWKKDVRTLAGFDIRTALELAGL